MDNIDLEQTITKAQESTIYAHAFLACTVYPKKYAHGFCLAVLCCSYTLTDFPISIRLTSLALWQSNDCPSASKATQMNMNKYFIWIHYERLHNHNKAKHNKTVCIFIGIYCNVGPFDNPLLSRTRYSGAVILIIIHSFCKWSYYPQNIFTNCDYLNQHWI